MVPCSRLCYFSCRFWVFRFLGQTGLANVGGFRLVLLILTVPILSVPFLTTPALLRPSSTHFQAPGSSFSCLLSLELWLGVSPSPKSMPWA